MKTDELLYEMMQDIKDKEAVWLEKELQDSSTNQMIMKKAKLQRQEKLTMDKIYAEMEMRVLVSLNH